MLPKNAQPITAHAAGIVDVQPNLSQVGSGARSYNLAGGGVNPNPATVSYSSLGGTTSNFNVWLSSASTKYIQMNNLNSTLALDMSFMEFTMSVTVPAGGKITVQYKFDATALKAACSSDASSHFCAELYHFGTGVNGDGANPVSVSSLNFGVMTSNGDASSVMRLDGADPTSVFSCTVSGAGNSDSLHTGSTVMGTPTANPAATGTYTTSEITYTNTTNANKTFKEYFGFMGCAGVATSSCHIFRTELTISTEKAEFEKVAKPTASGATSKNYDGTSQSFNVAGLTTKTTLVKAERKSLDGTVTTLYEYSNWPATPATATGTNPLSGNQCQFTAAGVYTLSFRPLGAVWSDTLDSTAVELKYYVIPKTINKPTVAASDVGGKAYNGSPQNFTLSTSGGLTAANWSTYIDIDTTKGGSIPTEVTDNSNGSFTITDAGDYDVYLTLADEENTCWAGSTYNATTWDISGAGGAHQVTLKVNAHELTVSLSCDKLESGNWAWNMGDTATVTVTVSDFLLATDTTETSADRVNLIYYYCVGTSTAENPVSATSETYDPTAKTITATIAMPTTLAQGTYTFGVKPDGNVGAGKNYTVSATLSKKNFTVSAKGFDPSVLLWTYTADGDSNGDTNRIADGDKLKYALNSSGSAVVYNPQILLITDTYDYTTKIAIDAAGYTGSTSVSAVNSNYATTVTLKTIDTDTKFVNTSSNPNVTVAADGKTATLKLNWQIEKSDLDLSGLKWEYWYKDGGGVEQTGEYTQALEYNDGRYIYVRIMQSSLPAGLSFDASYTTVLPPYETYGDRQRLVNSSYTTTFNVTDFFYDHASFNAPDASASTLTLNWEIEPKTITARLTKLAMRSYSNANGTGTYYARELDLNAMGCPATYASYFTLKYYDSTNTEVTLTDIDNAADPTNEKTYTVKAFIDTSVPAANNYKLVDASGNTPSATFKTGSSNSPATMTIDGEDGSSPIKVTFDGNPQFGGTLIEVKADDGTPITDFTVTYYTGGTPVAANELPAGELPTEAGEYCVKVTLGPSADSIYIVGNEHIPVTIEKQTVAVTVDGYDGSVPAELEYDGENHFDTVLLDAGGVNLSNFTVKYYKGTTPSAANELSGAPKDAGDYCAVIEITGDSASSYDLSADTFVLKIKKAVLDVPEIGELTFTGSPFTLDGMIADGKITGYDASIMTLTFAGASQVRNAGDYNAVIKLTEDAAKNYEFASTVTGAKYSFAAYALAVDSLSERTVPFTVAKAVLKADWDKSGETPVLKSLDKYKDVADVEAVINAYSDKNSDTPVTEMKKGDTYYFEATLTGPDAENFIFEDTGSNVSARLEYKLPQNGAAAFFGTAWGFVKTNWLWFVIALAVLLFLIILIIVIAKRRKNKEAREEKKAKKEEEKQRREEEKRRREEEREAAKAKQQAELELAKAKQEAELAKIKAQAAAGAGVAATAAAAQPQQQAMPAQQQPQYAQQPVPPQQPYYAPQPSGDWNAVIAKLETEFAKLRAEQAMSAYNQHPQYPPYQTAPAQNGGAGGMDIGTYMLMRLESDMQQLRAERASSGGGQPVYMPLQSAYAATQQPMPALPQPAQQAAQGDTAAITAAAVAAAVAAVTAQQKPEKEMRAVEAETGKPAADTPAAYPPDAVVTTTTTVDTTKKTQQSGSVRARRDDRAFDIDGFYDAFDGK